MSKFLPFLVVLVALLSLFHTPLQAQDTLRPDVQRIVAETRDAIAQRSAEQASAPAVVLDWVTIVSAHGEIGHARGRQRGVSVAGVYGPTGHVRGFIGHDVFRDATFRLALGYEGSLGYGLDLITASNRSEVVLSRHALGSLIQFNGVTATITAGLALMTDLNFTLVGATIQMHPGANIDGFWLGVPVGVDIWPDLGIAAVTIGLSLGGAVL